MSARRPRVVFLNRCYWPDTEATGQLLTDLCHELSDDFEVHVVCGQPNSPLRGAAFLESGVEVRDRVTIHRLRHTTYAKRFRFGRAINLLTFYYSAWRYLRRTSLRPDLVVSETDPFMLPRLGTSFAKRVDAKHVSYLQDIYPDVAEAIDKIPRGLGWTAKLIRRSLRKAYRASDSVIVLGSCMKQRLQSAPWSIAGDKIDVIPNWSDCQSITPVNPSDNPFRSQHGLEDRFVVMHSGNMGLTQRLDVLIKSTAHPDWPDNATLLLVGGGASRESLEQLAAEVPGLSEQQRKERIRFMDYQPREQLRESLSAADIHVVSMHENITGCLCPSKLYGILAAGRPVLAIGSQNTDLCQTVNEHHLGWSCEPGNPGHVAKLVAAAHADDDLRESIGRTSRITAESMYDRSVTTSMFHNTLVQLTHELEQDESVGLDIPDTLLSPSSEDSNFEVAPL